MMTADYATWARRLRAHAGGVFESVRARCERNPVELIEGFRDELGQRRDVDEPILMEVFGLSRRAGAPARLARGDVAVWWSLTEPEWDEKLITASGMPLLVHAENTSVEVRTESELSAMHALWAAGRVHGRPELQRRAVEAALWHVEHTQPDNATNHAWGVHVFVVAAARHEREDARMLAETLVHNCTVNMGKPDVLSACLLWHAAKELDIEGEGGAARMHTGTK